MLEEFHERQRFNQWWLKLILVGITVIAFYGFLQQVIFDKPFGNNPAQDSWLIGFLIASIVMNLAFFTLKLQTGINSKGIQVNFGILGKKNVNWTNVEKAEIIDYGFIGGWGLRYSNKYGKVYSTSGTQGIHIKLKDGNQFLVGTQKKDELMAYLNANSFTNSSK